jgi:hypothetical protein
MPSAHGFMMKPENPAKLAVADDMPPADGMDQRASQAQPAFPRIVETP